MAGSTSMELAIVEEKKKNRLSSSITRHWEVEYSRFINFSSSSSSSSSSHSSHPSLTPLKIASRSKGTWLTSDSSIDSLLSLSLLTYGADPRNFILLLTLGHKVLEEHYILKLHFTWPQVSCFSGYPARGSRVVFMSYKDSAGQIQKFALRFLSVYETEHFVNSLKEIFEDSSDAGEPCNNFGVAQSTQPECVILSESPYRPSKNWSPEPSADTCSHPMSSIINHETVQERNSMESTYYHPSGATLPDFPPSFTSLLMNCSPAVKQAGAQSSVSEDVDLKDQIARYLGDSSFQAMVRNIQKVFSEIGDDLII